MATTLTNVSQWISGGFAEAQYTRSSSGRPYNSATLTATNIVGTTVAKGAKVANVEIPEAEILQIAGDDGIRGVIQFPGNALPTFDLTLSDFSNALVNAVQGTMVVDVQSTYELTLIDPANRQFPDIFLMLTRRAVSTDPGMTGNGYETIIFPQATMSFAGAGGFETGANEGEYVFNVTVNRTSILPWGTPLTTGTHGSTAASGFIFWSQYVPTFDVAIKDGIITSWTLTKTYAANGQALTWKTVSGTTTTDSVTPDTANNQVDGVAAGSSGNILTVLYEKVTG
jgi:hypothetical protein